MCTCHRCCPGCRPSPLPAHQSCARCDTSPLSCELSFRRGHHSVLTCHPSSPHCEPVRLASHYSCHRGHPSLLKSPLPSTSVIRQCPCVSSHVNGVIQYMYVAANLSPIMPSQSSVAVHLSPVMFVLSPVSTHQSAVKRRLPNITPYWSTVTVCWPSRNIFFLSDKTFGLV